MLTKVRVMAAEIEVTPGTAETLTAPDAAFNVFEAKYDPNIEFNERPGQGGFSPLTGVPGPRAAQITFEHELLPGVAPLPAWATTFLPACGFYDVANTFTLKSQAPAAGSDIKTVTMGIFEDGVFKAIKGAVGTVVFTFTVGQPVRAAFTFTGLYVAPSDVAIIAPTYPTTAPLRFASSTFTLTKGSVVWSPKANVVTIDIGNDVQLREDPATAEGYLNAIITGRNITGGMDPEETLVATDPHYGDWLDRSERTLALELGAGAGGQVDFAAPAFQFTNIPEGDRDGIQTAEIEFQLNRSASAGDDDLTIAFG